ncbi:M48 family metallopeptidase [Kangiella sp. TOML190]|uniref:M48 family metallopeptidase n=1 Tax=Kangiella sp. TOML190 TaxID=2931351 RepID=UPI00203B3264|nr:M48 family metallopeptidase [Kangiella sp. TOML190]
MDFFEHQEAARRKTKLLVFYFTVAVILIVTALNLVAFLVLSGVSSTSSVAQPPSLAQWPKQPAFAYITLATLGLIGLGSLFRWFQLRGGGKSLARMVGAREVLPDTNDRLERRFINVVEEMAIASGMPVPTLFIMDEEEAINAFVAGQESSDTIMVVTRGALEQLTRQELQGVVAHEFSHIFNADMKINVRLISILAGILILGQAGYFVMRSLRYGNVRSSNNKEGGGLIAVVIVVGISMYIIGSIGLFFGRLIKAAISRQREFLADASAVQYARDNQGLAGAFIKIGAQSSLLENRYAEETSHMCIAQPIKLNFSGLATHPPLHERLDAIMPEWQDFQHQQERKAERIQQREIAAEERRQAQESKQGFEKFGGTNVLAGMGALIDTVGNPTTLHLHAANALLMAMPEVLRTAAHNHHASSHAMYLVFALLICDDDQQETQALDLISDAYGEDSRQAVIELATYITKDKRYLRLAIIDIAIPSLRRLSKTERTNFLNLLKQIIHLDKSVTQFEYVLYSLVRKSLQSATAKQSRKINRFNKVEKEIQLILSAMVDASGNQEDKKSQLFKNLMSGFTSKDFPLLPNQFEAESFHLALLKLNQLTPMLKKPLLNAFEEAIKDDGVINVEEVELLRAVAECLDCPLPPFVQNYSQELAEKIHQH